MQPCSIKNSIKINETLELQELSVFQDNLHYLIEVAALDALKYLIKIVESESLK